MRKLDYFPAFALLVFVFFSKSATAAQVFKTQDRALAETFTGADTVLRRTLFLDDQQLRKLQQKTRSKFDSRVISYYTGQKDGKILAFAFFDKQIVRTKEAITLIVVSPDGAVERIEVLAFMEPKDYLPIARWFTLFENKILSPGLWPGKQIHAVAGATLSVRAFTFAARRALALYQMIGTEFR